MHKRSLAFMGVLALTACGGGSGGIFGPGTTTTFQCDPGTSVQLANPTPNQFGVPTNIGSVIIVANGNANTLYNTYGNWQLVLTDNVGDQPIVSSPLSLYSDPNGPHPYASDFYYQGGNLPQLRSGVTYTVSLQDNSQTNGFGTLCNALVLQPFST